MGDFSLDGKTLRKKGINRIGNMLVPNKVIQVSNTPSSPSFICKLFVWVRGGGMVVMFSTVLNVHVHFLVIACMLSFFFAELLCI